MQQSIPLSINKNNNYQSPQSIPILPTNPNPNTNINPNINPNIPSSIQQQNINNYQPQNYYQSKQPSTYQINPYIQPTSTINKSYQQSIPTNTNTIPLSTY
jgi:hypothetical protein